MSFEILVKYDIIFLLIGVSQLPKKKEDKSLKEKNKFSMKNLLLYLSIAIVPLMWRLVLLYYSEVDKWNAVSILKIVAAFFILIAVAMLVYKCLESLVENSVNEYSGWKNLVLYYCLAILVVVVAGIFTKMDYTYIRPNTISIVTGVVVFPLAVFGIAEYIKNLTTKNTILIVMALILILSIMEVICFSEARSATLECIILINTVVVFAFLKANPVKKIGGIIYTIVSSLIFFAVNNVVLATIKDVFKTGKVINNKFYAEHRQNTAELFKSAKLIGKTEDSSLVNSNVYRGSIEKMCYENGYIMLIVFSIILIVFIGIILKLFISKNKAEMGVAYFSGIAAVSYFVIKTVAAVVYTFGISPVPVIFPFARIGIADVVALSIIIYCFIRKSTINDDCLEKGKEF